MRAARATTDAHRLRQRAPPKHAARAARAYVERRISLIDIIIIGFKQCQRAQDHAMYQRIITDTYLCARARMLQLKTSSSTREIETARARGLATFQSQCVEKAISR